MMTQSAQEILGYFQEEIENPITSPSRISEIISEIKLRFPNVEIIDSAIGVITDELGRKLLLKRASSDRSYPDVWCFPGGTRDNTLESMESTIVRETFEETGLNTRISKKIAVRLAIHLIRQRIYNVHCYELLIDGKKITPELSHEHSEWKYFSNFEIPEPIGKVTREMFYWSGCT